MSKPTDNRTPDPTPEEDSVESTVRMPGLKIIPDLSVPPATVTMPALKVPKAPHLSDDEKDKK
jgi:hypothetical protein